MNEYQAFYEMVRKWTVRDYRTQSIKSEVIIDMLVSEFIEEIVASGLENVEATDTILLAKEFPIRTIQIIKETGEILVNEKNNRNAKVDYLLTAKNQLYLVELKTSNDSLSKDQKTRMEKIIDAGARKLWEFFFEIAEGKLDATDKKKYRFTQEKMSEILQKRLSVNPQDMKNYLINSDFEITMLYICLCPTAKTKSEKNQLILKSTRCIYLSELNENEKFINSLKDKKDVWDKLYPILQELFVAAEYIEGKY